MEYQTYILENGLKIIHKNLNSHVAYCGFIVNVGTRDEKVDQYGMAHFVEHMLFKGTTKRKSYHIINRMESVGGEINAYTNKEETVLYSIFQETHFARAIELLADMIFHSTFLQREIEKEVDVIVDEIHSYEDNPSELIFDEFENMIFKNTELGHNILGEPNILKTFTTQKTIDFVKQFYLPQNTTFFYLGRTPFKKIVKLLEKNCNDINIENSHPLQRKQTVFNNPQYITVNKDTSQSHVLIGGKALDLYNPNKQTFQLINNILGGPGMNSRLNIALREKKGYVYTIESNLISYTDAGIFTIYFGCDNKNREKCIDLVLKELKKLRETKLSTIQLANAKKQIMGQISVASDNHENLALSIAKNYIRQGHIQSIKEINNKFETITSQNIIHICNETLNPNQLSYLIYT